MSTKGLHLFISKEAGTTPTGFVSYSYTQKQANWKELF